MVPVSLWLAVQTMLTLSRGGFWAAVVALTIVGWFATGGQRGSRGKLVLLAGSAVLLALLVLPRLDAYTGGVVSQRFSDSNVTGRDKIALSDLDIFRTNPVLGVGPGQSTPLHADRFEASFAHTEFTRLLSEHGSFGLLALGFLAWMTIGRAMRPMGPLEKGLVLALMAWALLTMAHSAMRLVAPSFVFGLAAARFPLGGVSLGRRPAARAHGVVPRPGSLPARKVWSRLGLRENR
jgi:hypothetical protein